MFQTGLPSIIRSTIQRQAFVRPLLLPAAGLDDPIQASSRWFCEVLCSWQWKEDPSETFRGCYRNE